MSFDEAFIGISLGTTAVFLLLWYFSCWYTMLFKCEKPSDFLHINYPTSPIFVMVNAVLTILALSQIIVWITN